MRCWWLPLRFWSNYTLPLISPPCSSLYLFLFYVILALFVGAFADSMAKGRVMFISNTIKILAVACSFWHRISISPSRLCGGGLGGGCVLPCQVRNTYRTAAAREAGHRQWLDRRINRGFNRAGHGNRWALISPAISSVLLAFDFPLIDTGVDTIRKRVFSLSPYFIALRPSSICTFLIPASITAF